MKSIIMEISFKGKDAMDVILALVLAKESVKYQ